MFSNDRPRAFFGTAPRTPIDKPGKAAIIAFARAYNSKHRRPGQHIGPLTRATLDVLKALLWGFHNAKDGRCFPSYDAIAEAADVARSTVYDAIHALEDAGIMTWMNQWCRTRDPWPDIFRDGWRWRIVRKSNAYTFGKVSQSENHSRTKNQVSIHNIPVKNGLAEGLKGALSRLHDGVRARHKANPMA